MNQGGGKKTSQATGFSLGSNVVPWRSCLKRSIGHLVGLVPLRSYVPHLKRMILNCEMILPRRRLHYLGSWKWEWRILFGLIQASSKTSRRFESCYECHQEVVTFEFTSRLATEWWLAERGDRSLKWTQGLIHDVNDRILNHETAIEVPCTSLDSGYGQVPVASYSR